MALRVRPKTPHSVTEKIRREKIKLYIEKLRQLVPANCGQSNLQQLYVLENAVEYLIWANNELEKRAIIISEFQRMSSGLLVEARRRSCADIENLLN
ncbi:hypothetical protein HK103_004582 [Boothiomyces macroporosus]|uniref:BHLH domain-containing protein n=1 Tax=Boothiomyces macroporosus TaxID=261099 RepID=A0AAD5Y5Q0_9FUNG|nr:hypothetical protein HK103_004582 [Boothiomyces macroporosus]